MILYDLLAMAQSATNILAGLLVFLLYFMAYRKITNHWKWINLSYAGIGLYWAILYTYILLTELCLTPAMDSILFGRLLVRTPLTFVLGTMASAGVIWWRTQSKHNGFRYLVEDMLKFYLGRSK